MSYCQGTLGPVNPGETDLYSSRNVTDCSSRKVLFAFNATAAWPNEITHGPQLEWPRVISDDFYAFRMTSRAMAVLYIIGVGAVGAVLLVKCFSIAMPRAQYGVFEFGLLVVSYPTFWFYFQIWRRDLRSNCFLVCCRLSCPLFFSCAFLASWPSYRGPTTITRDGFTSRRSTNLANTAFLAARLTQYKHCVYHRHCPCIRIRRSDQCAWRWIQCICTLW